MMKLLTAAKFVVIGLMAAISLGGSVALAQQTQHINVPCTMQIVPTGTLVFGGYTWTSRSEYGGPGPNNWQPQNARLDSEGHLHLQISNINGKWYCAEIETSQRLGFGTYQWQVSSPVDQLDRNVVLGLFNYPTPDVGADGTNEIDIEIARWGDASWPNGNYTVWPKVASYGPAETIFNFSLSGSPSTYIFTWTKTSVTFQAFSGSRLIKSWTFAPGGANRIASQPMPVFMNLWLFNGQAPSDGKPVDVEITGFKFTSA